MKDVVAIEQVKTMDSRELAELLSARHADVFESITTQLPKVGYTAVPYTYIHEQNGQMYQAYKLPYRETIIIASGYSIELRAKVIDRWMELEADSRVPKTYAEALQLAANQAKQIEKISKDLEIAAPKAAFFDQVADSKDAIAMREAAAVLNIPGMGRTNLFKTLREKGVLDTNNVPYRRFQDAGYFRVIETSYIDAYGESHVNTKTLVYQRGLDYIRKVVSA